MPPVAGGGYALAEAFVRIRPDASGFKAEASAKIKQALLGIKPEIKIGADAAAAKAKIADLQATLAILSRKSFAARLLVDDGRAQAQLARIAAQLYALNKTVAKPKVKIDDLLRAQASALGLSAELDAISKKVATAHVRIDEGDTERRLALLIVQLTALASKSRDLTIGVTDPGALAKIETLRAAIDSLHSRIINIGVGAGGSSVKDPLTGKFLSQAAAAKLLTRQVAGAEREVLGLSSEMGRLATAMGGAGDSGNIFLNLLSRWGPNFRRAGFGIFFTLSGLHLLIDAFIEIAAVVVPAILAITAFGAAAAPTVTAIYDHVHQLVQVFHATGKAIGPLTTQFSNLQTAMEPSVLQLYGQGLMIIQHGFGTFAKLANIAAVILDHFGARLVYDMQHGSGAVGQLLKFAGQDLTKLTQFFGAFFGAIGHLLLAMPHVAEFFLNIAVAAAKLLDWISKLPTPMLTFILLLHAVYLWGGLANQVFQRMLNWAIGLAPAFGALAQKIGLASTASAETVAVFKKSAVGLSETEAAALGAQMGLSKYEVAAATGAASGGRLAAIVSKLGALGASPWTWAIIGVAALGGLVYWASRTRDATQKLVASLVPLNKLGNLNFFAVAAYNLSKLNPAIAENAKQLAAARAQYGVIAPQLLQTSADFGRLHAAYEAQVSGTRNVLQGAARIQRVYGVSYQEALAIAAMAHVDLTKSITGTSKASASAWIQIQALMLGYKDMGVSGSQAASDVLAMQFALKQQDSQISQLNSAWDTYINTVTGGETTFLGFAQSLKGLATAFKSTQTGLTVSSGRTSLSTTLSAVRTAAIKAGGSMTGLNAASIQLRDTWQQAFQAGQQMIDALRLQGLEGVPLTHVIAGIAGQMLKYAGNSRVAREELVAMINQAVAPGTVNLRNLDSWIRKNGISMKSIDRIISGLTGNLDNLDKASRTLSTTMQQQVSKIFSQTALAASGTNKAIAKYANAILGANTSQQKIHSTWQAALTDLKKLGFSTHDATALLDGYAKAVGKQNLVTESGRPSRQHLINDLVAAGRSAHDSTGKIATMISQIFKIPKSRALELVLGARGHGSLTLQEQMAGQRASGFLEFHAAGGLIRGGTAGRDSVVAALQPGEVVVPTRMVQAGAVDHLRGKLPGFAGGGLVLTPGSSQVLSGMWAANADQQFNNAVGQFTELGLKSAAQSALHAADQWSLGVLRAKLRALTFGPGTGGISASGPLQNYARKLLAAYGWSNQWPSFNDIVMRESGWNVYATNPGSGAYGIPQALPASKMAAAGPDWRTSGYTQLRWMMAYIRSRWGDPIGADRNEQLYHWYDNGGWLKPGVTMAVNNTGRSERVLAPGEGGGTVNINVKVDPVIAAVTPDRRLGQHIAEHIKMATKSGTRLYAPGQTPR